MSEVITAVLYEQTAYKALGKILFTFDEGISRGFDLYDTSSVVWALRVELTLGCPYLQKFGPLIFPKKYVIPM